MDSSNQIISVHFQTFFFTWPRQVKHSPTFVKLFCLPGLIKLDIFLVFIKFKTFFRHMMSNIVRGTIELGTVFALTLYYTLLGLIKLDTFRGILLFLALSGFFSCVWLYLVRHTSWHNIDRFHPFFSPNWLSSYLHQCQKNPHLHKSRLPQRHYHSLYFTWPRPVPPSSNVNQVRDPSGRIN